MPSYQTFQPPVLNPKNASAVLDEAVSTAYRLSAGQLRSFLPGSPLMVLLETLVFVHMELLHWAENVPDALVFALFSKALGVGVLEGTYSEAVVTVSISTALSSAFVIPEGARVVSSVDSNIVYATTIDLVIPPGATSGNVQARALDIGPETAVLAGQLNSFETQYAYVQTITNAAASTIGLEPENTYTAQLRVKALMSQRNPSSPEDWINLAQEFFGSTTVVKVQAETPNLSIYIKNLVAGPALTDFEAEVNRQSSLLQTVTVKPYKSVGLDVQIYYTDSTPSPQDCIEIAQVLNTYIEDFEGSPQPIDIYGQFAEFTGNTNLANFFVQGYKLGILQYTRPLQTYSFKSGDIVVDTFGNYYQGTTNTHVVNSAFDEAELGLLDFYPVLENFTGGFVEKGFIVNLGGLYYLVNNTGVFSAPEATLLPAPASWGFNNTLTISDFISEPSTSSELSYGFIPNQSYTTALDWQTNLAPITPQLKNIGDTVSSGEVWYFSSQPTVLYTAASVTVVTNAYLQTLQPTNQVLYPAPSVVDHWLSNYGAHRIGAVTLDGNYIVTKSDGSVLALAPGLDVGLLPLNSAEYGSLFFENGEIYEFQTAFLAEPLDTSATLPVKRAVRKFEPHDFINYLTQSPYYLRISRVEFLRGNANDPEKVVIESSGGFILG